MCFICDREDNLFVALNRETFKYCHLEIVVNRQGMLRSRYFNDDDIMISQDIVNLHYCPICGKEFNKKKFSKLNN